MMMVKHRKTYTLEIDIDTFDSLYSMFREAYDKAKTDPFLHTQEIFDLIDRDVRPLVPFKKVHGYSYRLYSGNPDRGIKCIITFNFSPECCDFIH